MSYFLFLFLFIYFSLFSVKTLELLSLSHTNTSSNDSGSQCVLIEPQSSCPYNPHSPIVRCEYLYAWRLTSIITTNILLLFYYIMLLTYFWYSCFEISRYKLWIGLVSLLIVNGQTSLKTTLLSKMIAVMGAPK